MRLACDTGGTFTDLVVEDDAGKLHMFKAPTTPDDPVVGILDSVRAAAAGLAVEPRGSASGRGSRRPRDSRGSGRRRAGVRV